MPNNLTVRALFRWNKTKKLSLWLNLGNWKLKIEQKNMSLQFIRYDCSIIHNEMSYSNHFIPFVPCFVSKNESLLNWIEVQLDTFWIRLKIYFTAHNTKCRTCFQVNSSRLKVDSSENYFPIKYQCFMNGSARWTMQL